MVGHSTLNAGIGVQIPVPQPGKQPDPQRGCGCFLEWIGDSKQGAGSEASSESLSLIHRIINVFVNKCCLL